MKPVSFIRAKLEPGSEEMDLTIKDIAKMAHVSPATVSRVLNHSAPVHEKTRKVIEQIISENHYSPNVLAQGLSQNQSNTVGVIVPDICNPFFCEVIKGISSVADQHDLQIILCNTDENPKKEAEFLVDLKQQKVQGIIITPISESNEFNLQYLNLLESIGTPIVLVDRDVKYSSFDGVFIDNVKGAFDAVSALIHEGHRKIAIIAGPKTSKPGRDRLRGYYKAFDLNHIPISESLIYYGDFQQESGYVLTQNILKLPDHPTAIFSCNNLMTLGVLKALREKSLRIPDDISLVGFDRIELLDILGYPISYITRQTDEMGQIAMNLLLERIEKKERAEAEGDAMRRITLRPHLILKGSEKLSKKKEEATI